jgi:hypothetical protein
MSGFTWGDNPVRHCPNCGAVVFQGAYAWHTCSPESVLRHHVERFRSEFNGGLWLPFVRWLNDRRA